MLKSPASVSNFIAAAITLLNTPLGSALSSPLGRYCSRIARQTGSQSPEKRFRQMIRHLAQHDHLPDYHVEFDAFFYSVPHALIREQVDLRATARTIEVFHRGQRVAVHQRRYGGSPRHGTVTDHMPSSHRFRAEWTPERFQRWGRAIGPERDCQDFRVRAAG